MYDTKKVPNINWWNDNAGNQAASRPIASVPIDTDGDGVADKMYSAQPQQSAQATPFVQPLIIVPYSSPMQPLYHYDTSMAEREETYEDLYDDEDNEYLLDKMSDVPEREYEYAVSSEARNEARAKKARRVNAISIVLFLLSAISIVAMFDFLANIEGIGGFINLYNDLTVYQIVYGLVNALIGGTFAFDGVATVVDLLVVVGAVLTVIVALVSICTVCARGTSVFMKVLTALVLVINVAVFALARFMASFAVANGMYVRIAISAVIFLVALIGKRNKKAIK